MAVAQINDFIQRRVRVLSIREAAQGVQEIVFEKPLGGDHIPGQFVGIKVEDGKEEPGFRAYSLMDSEDGHLSIYVKKVDGGRGSTFLHSLKTDDAIEILYPLGYFGFPEKIAENLVFIATGTGIVPLLSLLEHIPEDHQGSIRLVFGVRSEEDIFCTERIEALRKKLPHLNFTLTLSRPGKTWDGASGRVTHILEKEPLPSDAQYFMCGAGQMIADVRGMLKKNGVPASQIFYEEFND